MKAKLNKLLTGYIPENAVPYCVDLWEQKPFHFKVTKKRNTKSGDYRFDPITRHHTITVNHDLNLYNFLITYIHEVAHLHTYVEFGRNALPHGKEWKRQFKILILPVLHDGVFPADILAPLAKHMKWPKATTYTDLPLIKALRKYDAQGPGHSLADLQQGDVFTFNQRTFKKEITKRTRVLCLELKTGRKYLIPKVALVELV